MEIHGDGLQTRTFTYVHDTADGIVRALERPESRGEVINLGGTETVTILELAPRCPGRARPAGRSRSARSFVPYESLPGKYQDVRHRIPDTAKAERLLGFEPRIGLAEGLRETVEWHRAIREAGGTAAGAVRAASERSAADGHGHRRGAVDSATAPTRCRLAGFERGRSRSPRGALAREAVPERRDGRPARRAQPLRDLRETPRARARARGSSRG